MVIALSSFSKIEIEFQNRKAMIAPKCTSPLCLDASREQYNHFTLRHERQQTTHRDKQAPQYPLSHDPSSLEPSVGLSTLKPVAASPLLSIMLELPREKKEPMRGWCRAVV